jgi:hypothetical protein
MPYEKTHLLGTNRQFQENHTPFQAAQPGSVPLPSSSSTLSSASSSLSSHQTGSALTEWSPNTKEGADESASSISDNNEGSHLHRYRQSSELHTKQSHNQAGTNGEIPQEETTAFTTASSSVLNLSLNAPETTNKRIDLPACPLSDIASDRQPSVSSHAGHYAAHINHQRHGEVAITRTRTLSTSQQTLLVWFPSLKDMLDASSFASRDFLDLRPDVSCPFLLCDSVHTVAERHALLRFLGNAKML